MIENLLCDEHLCSSTFLLKNSHNIKEARQFFGLGYLCVDSRDKSLMSKIIKTSRSQLEAQTKNKITICVSLKTTIFSKSKL
jgi:hypothetical protein